MAQEKIIIRQAILQDLPYLYEISLKTADSGADARALFNDPYAVGQYYAAPYLIYPEGICFVAEQEFLPRGYIVSVPNTAAFNLWMEEVWLPPLRRRYPQPFPPAKSRSEEERRILTCFHETLPAIDPWPEYPAELHINLLPEIQRRNLGRALMETLCAALSRQGVPGVRLGVGARNAGGIAFYRKVGFITLREEAWGFVMGKRLQSSAHAD